MKFKSFIEHAPDIIDINTPVVADQPTVQEVPPANVQDRICCDVPLFIRIMEYAREDAKTDVDLHNVAERMIQLSADGRTLGMGDYETICPAVNTNEIQPSVTTPVNAPADTGVNTIGY